MKELEIKGKKFTIFKSEHYTSMLIDNKHMGTCKFKKIKNTIIVPACIVCNKGFSGRDTCHPFDVSLDIRKSFHIKKRNNLLCDNCYNSIFVLAMVKYNGS